LTLLKKIDLENVVSGVQAVRTSEAAKPGSPSASSATWGQCYDFVNIFAENITLKQKSEIEKSKTIGNSFSSSFLLRSVFCPSG
jgi:hypothetical protein